MEKRLTIAKPVWWTGTILKGLLCLFLAFDALMKLIKISFAVEGTLEMGLPEACIRFLGAYLMLATALYIYSRTLVLGMLLLVAYLGAAAAIMYRTGAVGHPYLFPIIFAVLIVIAEFLRNQRVRALVPFAT